ncbi:MAG: maleylpyruvate isomerase N-terminal domain-containing protein, partial [Dehalococcoidia bacterium]
MNMNPDVEVVVAELDAHRERFEQFCRGLTADQLDRPVPQSTWLVRDFIAHLATIDGPVQQMFDGMLANGEPRIGTPDGQRFEIDHWNDGQVADRRARTVEDLLTEAAVARASLRASLAQFTREQLDTAIPFGGDSKRPATTIQLVQYLRGWCKHDPMHVVDMMRALPEARTPELASWFDDPIIDGYQRAMNSGA